jgi:catechol O-methyltransferase
MMFLDHYKPAYATDLQLCESLGLIVKGTALAADNVIQPGNPPYLNYVRSSVHQKRMALTQASGQDT